MDIFYSTDIGMQTCRLGEEESAHCVKVLRHRKGDSISVIGRTGCMYECRIISDSPKAVEAEILDVHENWGAHPYTLHMAVAPTQNADRYERSADKASFPERMNETGRDKEGFPSTNWKWTTLLRDELSDLISVLFFRKNAR